MESLAVALRQLREERMHAKEQVKKLDQAIVAIEGIVGKGNLGFAGRGQKGKKTDNVCGCTSEDRCGSEGEMGAGQEPKTRLGYH